MTEPIRTHYRRGQLRAWRDTRGLWHIVPAKRRAERTDGPEKAA